MHRNHQTSHPPRHRPVRIALPITVLAFLLALPIADAQDNVDATIQLDDTAPPICDCPAGWFTSTEWAPGEAAEWQLELPQDYTVVDLDMPSGLWDTTRTKQVVPLLDETHRDYPLFQYFPRPDIWTTHSHVRLYHYIEAGDTHTLRLGIPGPNTGMLRVERDTTAPEFTLGPVHSVTHFGFQQNTTTNEFAIGDLQRRPAGTDDEWVSTPTPAFNLKQIFPLQGMDPDTTYEIRALFTDWADNQAASGTYTVRTLPRPEGAAVTVTPISPNDGATIASGEVRIEARVTAEDSVINPDFVRLFMDLKEVPDGFAFNGENLVHVTELEPGPHVVSVEATSFAGGTGYARWTFEVEGANEDTGTAVAPGIAAMVSLLVGLGLASRARNLR